MNRAKGQKKDDDEFAHVWVSMHSEAEGSDASVCIKCGEWRRDDDE